jgi:hypothetical protein
MTIVEITGGMLRAARASAVLSVLGFGRMVFVAAVAALCACIARQTARHDLFGSSRACPAETILSHLLL